MTAEAYIAPHWETALAAGWLRFPEWATAPESKCTNGTPSAIVGLFGDGI